MKYVSIFLILFIANFVFSKEPCNEETADKKRIIIIEGIVEKMSDPVPPSGVLANYRLVKYKVIKVCKGNYDKNEIVIDHFINDGEEQKGIQVGSKVYVSFIQTKEVDRRFNFEGIRKSNEVINEFYLGFKTFTADKSDCSYNESDLLSIKK